MANRVTLLDLSNTDKSPPLQDMPLWIVNKVLYDDDDDDDGCKMEL